jgi:hypothetical protein
MSFHAHIYCWFVHRFSLIMSLPDNNSQVLN